ncbi:hypothetical protein ACJ41O_006893 [Fusarium nematophilum]
MADVSPDATALVAFKRRGPRSKGNLRKRPAISEKPPNRDGSTESSSSDEEDDASQGLVARRRRKGIVSASSTAENKTVTEDHGPTVFSTNCDLPLTETNDATKRKDWHDQPSTKGPARAGSNVRITTTMDFKPDVCKDYKKNGWCSFGDTCIFLHDRSDVKQGWQLDREWESVSKKKGPGGTVVASASREKAGQDKEDDDEAMLEKLPLACPICEGPYRQPIVTRCGHYFCEPCALKRFRKDPTCKQCGAATNGVFNAAPRLERLISRKRERAAGVAPED